ncbi:MAG: ABC transporter permease [Clostridia bacterium]|nr:ABC transporter permease [Clostridia bacterium]
MALFILKRVGYSIITLFIIITIIFFIMHSIPGNVYSSDKALPPAIEKNIRAKYGLDEPLVKQYLITVKNAVTLDFGMSMKNEGRGVNDIIWEHFPKSATVGIFSIIICIGLGVFLGIISAIKVRKWEDKTVMLLATVGVTVPSFVVASLLQYYLCVKLRIFPTMGLNSLWHAVLPAFALALFPLSFISRLIRSSMVEVMEQDYIRTARAKGLKEGIIIFKHALKNSLLPVITYMGPLIAGILTGSFVIEKIFNIPGLGRYFVESIANRDYTVIMGVSIFYAVFLIAANFVVDILYVTVDPRIKLKG